MDDQLQSLIRQHCQLLEPIPTDLNANIVHLPDIRAILFDIYGTLLISGSGDIGADSGAHRAGAVADTVSEFGLALSCPADAALKHFEAQIRAVHAERRAEGIEYPEVDIVAVWENVLPLIVSDPSVNVDNARFSLEYELRANPVWLMPGFTEMQGLLKDAPIMRGIVSNAQFFTPLYFPALTNRSLTDLGFDAGLTYFSYRYRRAKPGVFLFECARHAVAQLDISEHNVLYVGNDMLNDIATAAEVGFRTALFAGDRRSLRLRTQDARVRGVTPDVVVTDLRQIPMCLQ